MQLELKALYKPCFMSGGDYWSDVQGKHFADYDLFSVLNRKSCKRFVAILWNSNFNTFRNVPTVIKRTYRDRLFLKGLSCNILRNFKEFFGIWVFPHPLKRIVQHSQESLLEFSLDQVDGHANLWGGGAMVTEFIINIVRAYEILPVLWRLSKIFLTKYRWNRSSLK